MFGLATLEVIGHASVDDDPVNLEFILECVERCSHAYIPSKKYRGKLFRPKYGRPVLTGSRLRIYRFCRDLRTPRLSLFRRPWARAIPEADKFVRQHYHDGGIGRTPRDYQVNSINAAIGRTRRVDTAFEVCPGLYWAIGGPKAHRKAYRHFPSGFFDLIAIDECHRGSDADDSAWREVPKHFSPATRIGLTAPPKETKYVSDIACFGEPRLLLLPDVGHPRRLPLGSEPVRRERHKLRQAGQPAGDNTQKS